MTSARRAHAAPAHGGAGAELRGHVGEQPPRALGAAWARAWSRAPPAARRGGGGRPRSRPGPAPSARRGARARPPRRSRARRSPALEVGDRLGGGLLRDAEPLARARRSRADPARGAGRRRRRRTAGRPSRRRRSAAGPRPPSPSRRTARPAGGRLRPARSHRSWRVFNHGCGSGTVHNHGCARPSSSATAHRIVWCGVATVDRRGRPRSRILHPYWERTGDGLRGWVVTRRSPLKVAHLERTPYLSCTYWDATHDVAIADCHAAWEEDRDEHDRVWDALRAQRPSRSATTSTRSGPRGRPRPAPRCCGWTRGACTSPTR